MIQHSSSISLFCRRPLWAVLAWAGMSTIWCCLSSISSADHSITHPPRCPEGWFGRGCHGVWHAQTMQVSITWQLSEEISVDPQGSWSCPAPSRWSCAPIGDVEKFPQALGFESLVPFFRVRKQGPCFTAVEEDGGDKSLVQLELIYKADDVAPQESVKSGHCCRLLRQSWCRFLLTIVCYSFLRGLSDRTRTQQKMLHCGNQQPFWIVAFCNTL